MQRVGAVFVFGAMILALLCIAVASLWSAPVGAQADPDPLAGDDVTLEDTDNDEVANRVLIGSNTNCTIGENASVTVQRTNGAGDAVGQSTTLQNADQVRITQEETEIVVERTDEVNLNNTLEGSVGEVVESQGITCRRAAADDKTDRNDDLDDLDCDELLVLFRGEGQGQYEDGESAVDLNDSEVRAQIEVCLKQEIVNEPGGKLPKTGGLSLLAVAVLGVVSAAAGLSVIRGGRGQG